MLPLVVPRQSLRIVIDYKWTIPAQFGIHWWVNLVQRLPTSLGKMFTDLHCSMTFCPLPHPSPFSQASRLYCGWGRCLTSPHPLSITDFSQKKAHVYLIPFSCLLLGRLELTHKDTIGLSLVGKHQFPHTVVLNASSSHEYRSQNSKSPGQNYFH